MTAPNTAPPSRIMAWLRQSLVFIPCAILAAIAAYLTAALLMGAVPLNKHAQSPQGIPIYINRYQDTAEIILPAQSSEYNWLSRLNPIFQTDAPENPAFIAISLIPQADPPLPQELLPRLSAQMHNAIDPLMGKRPTYLRVRYLERLPAGVSLAQIQAPTERYSRLAHNIAADLSDYRPSTGNQYPARPTYTLINTSNSWLNDHLTQAQLPAVLWTPFAAPLTRLGTPVRVRGSH